MKVKAKAKYIRMSPRKVRLVVDLIRGLDVEKADNQLQFIDKAATRPVKKLLDSAVANAHHNFEIEKDNLYIKEIRVDEGPTLNRWKSRAFGRATPIRKRSSHISLILEEKVPTKKVEKKQKESAFAKASADKKKEEISKVSPEQLKKDVSKKPVSQKVKEPVESEEAREPFDTRMKGKHRDRQHLDKKTMKNKGFLKKIFKRKSST